VPSVGTPKLPRSITSPTSGTAPPSQSDTGQSGTAGPDIVEKTQPAARLAIILLAIMMAAGLFAKGGKLTMSSALMIGAAVIGYFVFLISNKDVQNTVTAAGGTVTPMYGMYLVIAGAVIGFAGGVLARYQTRST
jgi:hypothetical protein